MKLHHLLIAAAALIQGLSAAADEALSLVQITKDGLYKQRPAWSPDGKSVVFARHRGSSIFLFVANSDGSAERRLTNRKEPEYDAVWSPDGKRLAFSFVKVLPNQGDVDVYTISAAGADLKPVAVTGAKLSHEESPAWSPDGSRIAFSSTKDGNQELYAADSDGQNVKRLTSDPGVDAHPTWSTDGKQIAFATDRWGDLEIAVVSADGSNMRRLTSSKGLDEYPAWSPDGRAIAFTSNRDGNFEIYLMDADGKNPRNFTRDPGIDNFAAWTKDGRLSFVSNRGGGFDIYVTAKPMGR